MDGLVPSRSVVVPNAVASRIPATARPSGALGSTLRFDPVGAGLVPARAGGPHAVRFPGDRKGRPYG